MRTLLGLALFIQGCLAAPTSSTGAHTTISVQAAVHQLQVFVSKEVDVLWTRADTNGDGHFTASDMNVIFVDYDHNNDSEITKSEFTGQFASNEPDLDAIARGLFAEFDVDRNNKITHHDLDLFYQRLDSDDNGKVEHSEFKKYFSNVLSLLFVYQLQQQGAATTASV